MSEQFIGQTVNRYRLDSLISNGSLGAVYQATDLKLEREVALKLIVPQVAQSARFQAGFSERMRRLVDMDHPGLIRIFDFDQTEAHTYVVMERLRGNNLLQMLGELRQEKRWIDLADAVAMVHQISDTVDYAHQHDIPNQDVRPNNIMFKSESNNGLPYQSVLTDLGLDRVYAAIPNERLSLSKLLALAPEYFLGQSVDHRSNIYSLGVLLYILATGNFPYNFKTLQEGIEFHQTGSLTPPRTAQPDLPEAVEAIILKAMAKDAADRYPDAAAFGKALAELSIEADPEAPQADPIATTISRNRTPQPRWLIVQKEDGETDQIAIEKTIVTLGRDPDNDVVLDYPNVSRYHASLEFDGTNCRITDLGSTNNTYLDQIKLIPQQPIRWQPNQTLRIGHSLLQLHYGDQPATVAASAATPDAPAVVEKAESPPPEVAPEAEPEDSLGRLEVIIDPDQFLVIPGQTTSGTITLVNHRKEDDSFRVTMAGIHPSWVLTLPQVIEVPAGERGDIELKIQPPQAPQSRAGRYRLTIKAVGQKHPDHAVEITRTLTVSAYTQFKSDLFPESISSGDRGQVTIENNGNARQSFQITFQDPGNELIFKPPEGELRVPEGQSAVAEFQVGFRNRQLIGNTKTAPFSVRVSSADGVMQSHDAQVSIAGFLPVWLVSILIFLCLTFVIAAAFIRGTQNRRTTEATTTAIALATAPIATQTALAQNATATAVYLGQDDDRDGLTNGQEIELNTRPDLRDTDEDGLDDGDEVNRGTDPLNPDTDGDGIRDGDEVNRGIDPLNPDTDGDGEPDASDPDPGRLPTATPTLTPTPSPANSPPVVAITEPVAGSNFTAPVDIRITANPADNDGTITKVEFFAGPQLIGTATTSPYRVVWQNVRGGTYQLTAVATDDDGATVTSVPVTITVTEPQNVPPSVSITNPSNGATFAFGSDITIAANPVAGDSAIKQVDFFAGPLNIGSAFDSPYQITWDNVSAGTYQLVAVAIDNDDDTGSSPPVNITVTDPDIPPIVSLIEPNNGATFDAGDDVTITANAIPGDSVITQVQFFANGTSIGSVSASPYRITWEDVAAGTYQLTATATDNDGDTATTDAVNITVNAANVPPTVSITQPTTGTTFTEGEAIILNATASDSDGTVAQVQYFVGGTAIGTATTSPYSVTWTAPVSGSYVLTADATDDAGGSTTSAPVNITVTAPVTGTRLLDDGSGVEQRLAVIMTPKSIYDFRLPIYNLPTARTQSLIQNH